jgi:hypothetical protein
MDKKNLIIKLFKSLRGENLFSPVSIIRGFHPENQQQLIIL